MNIDGRTYDRPTPFRDTLNVLLSFLALYGGGVGMEGRRNHGGVVAVWSSGCVGGDDEAADPQ